MTIKRLRDSDFGLALLLTIAIGGAARAAAAGACCLEPNGCQPADNAATCGALGGVYIDAADCSNSPCAVGACCNGTQCIQTSAFNCIFNGRDWVGAGIPCSGNPCGFTEGTCCVGGACLVVRPASCTSLGGTFLGAGSLCPSAPCVNGACCLTNGCVQNVQFQCAAQGGTFFAGADCAAQPCNPPGCPAASLFSQGRDGPNDNFLALTSEESVGIRRYEDFSGVAGPIEGLLWAGLDAQRVGNAWVECAEADPTFVIRFYDDAGGFPGSLICDYTVVATRSPTGVLYNGLELNEYGASLPSSCVLVNGWVSIVGLGDPDCWFLWMSAGVGASYCDGCAAFIEDHNVAICMLGEAGGVTGACCNEATSQCLDNVDITTCLGPNQVFHPGAACADLQPPCGVILGACCRDDATCSILTEAACAAGGGTWRGPHTLCSQCPCLAPCPEGAIPEGEQVCAAGYFDDYNSGCFGEPQNFSPLTLGDTICGTSGVYDAGGDVVPDRDWYEFHATGPATALIDVYAEFAVRVVIYDAAQGCAHPPVIASGAAPACTTVPLIADLNAGTYWVVVAPDGAATVPCGARYTLRSRRAALYGDMNCDGAVNNFDIDSFVLALIDPPAYAAAYPTCNRLNGDVNRDNAFNNFDIDPFVNCIVASPAPGASCP